MASVFTKLFTPARENSREYLNTSRIGATIGKGEFFRGSTISISGNDGALLNFRKWGSKGFYSFLGRRYK